MDAKAIIEYPVATMKSAQITAEITAQIQKYGGKYQEWYCGITKDVESRLFGDHGVVKGTNAYSYRNADSDKEARAIEEHFLAKGCQGGNGGGDDESNIIYAYKIGSNTTE